MIATKATDGVTTLEVSTQVSGIIDETVVDFNHGVHEGQVIAGFAPTLIESAVRDAATPAQLQMTISNPHFSPGFVARSARCSAQLGFRSEGRAGVLDST